MIEHTRIAAAAAAVAQAVTVAPTGGDLLSMMVNVAPQLIFGIAVYYMFTKSQDKTAGDIKELADKFTSSLDRTTDRFEKQQQTLVDELRLSAQQDRDQHGKLFGDFAGMTREVVVQLTTLRQEFLAFKAEQIALLDDRRRSAAAPPEFRPLDRPRDVDDPPLPVAKPRRPDNRG